MATYAPTMMPTYAPTMMPTYAPTMMATYAPMMMPTYAPTMAPTMMATYAPTMAATMAPTIPPMPAKSRPMTSFPPIPPPPPPIDRSKRCIPITEEELNFRVRLHVLQNDVTKMNSDNIQNDEYFKYYVKYLWKSDNDAPQILSYIDEVYKRPFEKYMENIDNILKTLSNINIYC